MLCRQPSHGSGQLGSHLIYGGYEAVPGSPAAFSATALLVSETIGCVEWANGYRKKINGVSAGARELFAMGASYWDGPGHAGPRFAALMNFGERDNPDLEFRRIAASLRANDPLSALDLTRALLATEIGWVSAVLGPSDWENLHGLDRDVQTLEALRSAQDELGRLGVPASGTNPFGSDRVF